MDRIKYSVLFIVILAFFASCGSLFHPGDVSNEAANGSSFSGNKSSSSSSSAPSSEKAISSFGFTSALNSGAGISSDVTGAISGTNITLNVPYGTAVTALKATFTITGASISVGSAGQTSGVTANNFTKPVIYTVAAADGSTRNYAVTVIAAPSYAKAITAFGFTSAVNIGEGVTNDVTGVISGANIALTVPYCAGLTNLKATYSTTGASVKVGSTVQTSGTTANNFTGPVVYTVTAADGTKKNYTVTAAKALNSAKAITAFGFTSALNSGAGITNDVSGVFSSGTNITLNVPFGTVLTALKATFAASVGSTVKVGTTVQTSGSSADDFTTTAVYTVIAADGTAQNYTVNVIPALSPAKDITSLIFTCALNNGAGIFFDVSGVIAGTNINLTVPYGTTVTALKATFTTTGSVVKVGSTVQTSGTTANDFTGQVSFSVVAADGSMQYYKVTVAAGTVITLGSGASPAFNGPADIDVDSSGNVFVCDRGNNLIRKISTNGAVTTLGSSPSPPFNASTGVAVDSSGNIYVGDRNNNLVRKISASGVVTSIGTGASPAFSLPQGVAVDSSGNVYVADLGNSLVRRISPAGTVTTLGGTTAFSFDADVDIDSYGNIYVADQGHNLIKKISNDSTVTTLGAGASPAFIAPGGVAVDKFGNVYVTDLGNNLVREITFTGAVINLGGNASPPFKNPNGVAVDSSGNVFVADYGNSLIREIIQ